MKKSKNIDTMVFWNDEYKLTLIFDPKDPIEPDLPEIPTNIQLKVIEGLPEIPTNIILELISDSVLPKIPTDIMVEYNKKKKKTQKGCILGFLLILFVVLYSCTITALAIRGDNNHTDANSEVKLDSNIIERVKEISINKKD